MSMVSLFTHEFVSNLRSAFRASDLEGTGRVSSSLLPRVAASLGHAISEEELLLMLNTSAPREITFPEFLTIMHKKLTGLITTESEIKIFFSAFDKNGNGYIEKDELKDTMAALGETMTDDEIADMIKEADIDVDGRINYEEFVIMMIKKHEMDGPS